MSDYKAQARPDRASQAVPQKISRHRAEPAAPATRWGRLTAGIPSFGRRAAVATTACAVLIGVGAAGQAAEQAAPQAGSEAATAAASAAQTLNFDKTLISALPCPDRSRAGSAVGCQAGRPRPPRRRRPEGRRCPRPPLPRRPRPLPPPGRRPVAKVAPAAPAPKPAAPSP